MALGVVLLVVNLALAYWAYKKSQIDQDAPKPGDGKSNTLSERGSFQNFVRGRREVQPFVGWLDPEMKVETIEDIPRYRQRGWHQLCMGVGDVLWKITTDTEVIWKGPITRQTHPSGTKITISPNSAFYIFWGEADQPVSSLLSAPDAIGIDSGWPLTMHVVWDPFNLKTTDRWPQVKYDISCGLYQTFLTSTEPTLPATEVLNTTKYGLVNVKSGAAGVAYFLISGKHIDKFQAQGKLRLTGNAAPDKDYEIDHSQVFSIPDPQHFGSFLLQTKVFVAESINSQVNVQGFIQPYNEPLDDGINPAHLMCELLFSPMPVGFQLDLDEYDLNSFEAASQIFEEEHLGMNILHTDGQQASTLVGQIMQEAGCMLPFDPAIGRYRLAVIRKPVGTVPVLPADVLIGDAPEGDHLLADIPADKLAYVFKDRAHLWRDMTIVISDDGKATLEGHASARKLALNTVTDYATASMVGERRAQEESAGNVRYRVVAGREARKLIPGVQFKVEGFPHQLIAASVSYRTNSNRVNIDALLDVYGVEPTTFAPTGPPVIEPAQPLPALSASVVEVPAWLLSGNQTKVIVPYIRANSLAPDAEIYLAPGDGNFSLAAGGIPYQTGCTLDSDWKIGSTEETDGPVVSPLGPDLTFKTLNLNGNEYDWRAGKQWLVSQGGTEICFLRSLVVLGNNKYRLDGVIRARYHTEKVVHPAGTIFYIFTFAEMTQFLASSQTPFFTQQAKVLPKTTPALDLEVMPVTQTFLNGLGKVPMSPRNVRTVDGSNGYLTGEDIDFKWDYFNGSHPEGSAGLFDAGEPWDTPPVEGTFKVKIYTIGGVLKRTVNGLGNANWTYTNAHLDSDFGGEPASFVIRVTNVKNGYSAGSADATITKGI